VDSGLDAGVTWNNLDDPAAWTKYDLGMTAPDLLGAQGIVSGGRYIYVIPNYGPLATVGNEKLITRSGIALRYDTERPISDAAAWEAFDTAARGAKPGFVGGVFDGRYVYYVPYGNAHGTGIHANVVRFDSRAPFTAPESWQVFDLNEKLTPGQPNIGYAGGAFDGNYVYFVASTTADSRPAVVVRFDPKKPFDDVASWQRVDAAALLGQPALGGFWGAAFDGARLYFLPHENTPAGEPCSSRMAVYDTRKALDDASAWLHVNLSEWSPNLCGFASGVFDGTYLYLLPYLRSTALRIDTRTEEIVPANAQLFQRWESVTGATFDGRFVNFHMRDGKEPVRGGFLGRYDTRQPFKSEAAWSRVDLATIVPSAGAFCGMAYDGSGHYLAPCELDRPRVLMRFQARSPRGEVYPGSSFF
jgi:hypothetical protein